MIQTSTTTTAAVADFIRRWEASGAAERANYQLFLSELCDLLGVVRPEPTRPDDRDNAYVFERSVTFRHGDGTTSTGRIDLYTAEVLARTFLRARTDKVAELLATLAAIGQAREVEPGTYVG